MAQASDYLEDVLADFTVGSTPFLAGHSPYLALCTAAPIDADTGSTITEASYTSYARVSMVSKFAASSGGVVVSDAVANFPTATGGSETITHFALCDASTGGNMLVYGTLDASLAVSSGITPSFAAGAITVTVG